ncbi:MAG: helix-turn-helix domain-containing protein [Deferribacteraceae bacterium]|jgi:transcriptional regulator with XRE-family HTH domain|nr:helix-turn-helix domain-containing protein [Deferribacteraceae bacterium]
MNSQVGDRVRILRQLIGLNQDDLGSYLGVSHDKVSRIERGLTELEGSLIIKFSEIFDVNSDWLLDGTEPIFSDGTNIYKGIGLKHHIPDLELSFPKPLESELFEQIFLLVDRFIPDRPAPLKAKVVEYFYTKFIEEITPFPN